MKRLIVMLALLAGCGGREPTYQRAEATVVDGQPVCPNADAMESNVWNGETHTDCMWKCAAHIAEDGLTVAGQITARIIQGRLDAPDIILYSFGSCL